MSTGAGGSTGSGQQGSLRVLLVEDSRILTQRLLELICDDAGVQPVGAVATEAEAIAAIAQQTPDVVVLDLRLKEGSGFGVLEYLRQQPRRPVVVVMTNYALPQYRQRARELGAEYFLDKMREFEQLPDVLRAVRAATST